MTRRPTSLSPAGQDDPFLDLIAATLRKVVVALRDEEVTFALGGSIASWIHGGPGPTRDVDLMVKPEEAEQTLDALGRAGLRTDRPAENWLFKAWDDETPVDVIFRPGGLTIDDEILGRAEELSVMGVPMKVMAIDDVLATKLLTLNEHALDYEPLLAIARAVREQIDWDRVRSVTAESPYVKAFFTLVEELGVAPAARGGAGGGPW
jgi:predicted nucleotidyltransferase